jgi:hypothetical protein
MGTIALFITVFILLCIFACEWQFPKQDVSLSTSFLFNSFGVPSRASYDLHAFLLSLDVGTPRGHALCVQPCTASAATAQGLCHVAGDVSCHAQPRITRYVNLKLHSLNLPFHACRLPAAAVIFVCYRAGRDSRQQEYDEEAAGATQRATIVLSILPHSAAAAAVAGQPYDSSTRPRSQRKSPTPPTIIRNLPVVIWDKPKAVSSAHASAHEKDASSVKDAAGKEAGNQDASHASTDSSEEGQERLCVICCCEYEAGESIKLLPCLHMYHQGCIDAWLGRSHVCPVCQVRLEPQTWPAVRL